MNSKFKTTLIASPYLILFTIVLIVAAPFSILAHLIRKTGWCLKMLGLTIDQTLVSVAKMLYCVSSKIFKLLDKVVGGPLDLLVDKINKQFK